MLRLFLVSLLVGLVGCSWYEEDSSASMRVSADENTWMETTLHWTGGFSGSQHDEFQVYYVRRGKWWQKDERRLLSSSPDGPMPTLRRIAADTIAVDFPEANWTGTPPIKYTVKYSFKGPWPK